MRHRAAPSFWAAYDKLPLDIRKRANAAFEKLKADPEHPSLRFKKVGRYWSARVTDGYRALAVQEAGDMMIWFWIGSHADYDKLLR